ncbi:MAG: carbonic anhydrase [Bacteroidia bacterium]|nr:carbonic anhydrase [Bacteroidia bacterium]
MNEYEKLLLQNKSWVSEKTDSDKDYFKNLADIQKPEFLWIGCSDSRVPANEITNTEPGEIFVHRNIANLVVNTDLNMLSVLKYAVEVLKVKHIIVCGHYGCGGVKAAITNHHYGLLNKWLRNIKDVYRLHNDELNKIENLEDKTDALVELNIIEQVNNLVKTSIIQKAWHNNQLLTLHGCVYGLKNGILKDLIQVDKNTPLDPLYQFDFDNIDED